MMSAMLPRLRRGAVIVGIAIFALVAWRTTVSAALPDHTGYVTDLASVLDPATEAAIEAMLADVEQRTTAEIAVVTVRSLDGMTVEDYANCLFKQWGIGQKGKDNGVLILVAPTERKIRIEVGYGLEPVLPDGLAGEIIRQSALPPFRSGDVSGGTTATVDRIAALVMANHTVTPEERARLAEEASGPSGFASTIFFGMFLVLGFLALGVGLRTKTIFMTLWGGLFGGIPFVIALIPFFNASRVLIVTAGLAVFAVGWVKGGSQRWRDIARGTTKGRRRGKGAGEAAAASSGWVMGNTRSSGSSSSRSSSSFGGGRSGGGGASGSW
jgi:uncharacterized protein